MTVIKDGYHGDTSRMFTVGKASIQSKRLCEITRQSMIEGIKVVNLVLQLVILEQLYKSMLNQIITR